MHRYNKSRIRAAYHITNWVFILILCNLFVMPERVMGIEEDLYRLNTLKLDIDFSYNSINYKTSSTSERTESIEQRYRLNVKGLLINPDLIIYNAGIELVDTDTERNNSQSRSNVDKYVFDATLLRKSRIPLTLTARRVTSDTGFGALTTTDTFGADWHLKFRTLPWTKLNYDKTQTKSAGRNDETETSGIEMSKIIGPTDNMISYSSTTTSNSINYGSVNNVVAVRNDTTVPRVADFYLGVVKNDYSITQDNDKRATELTAGSVGVRTEPLAGLDQYYNYTFTNNKSIVNREINSTVKDIGSGEINSEFFNGKIGYKPTKRMDMFMEMQSMLSEASSATTDKMSKSINLSTGVRSKITRELSTTELMKYSQAESTTGDPLTGKTERTVIDTSASLGYEKKLSWSVFSAGSSVGHYKETVKPDAGGEGVSYGVNTGLSGIDMNYFTLSSGYGYSVVDSYSADVDREEQTFRSDAASTYVSNLPFTVSYLYHTLDSYLDGEDGIEDTVSSTARVLYLKWLPINATYRHYTLLRPENPPPDLKLVHIRDKKEDTVTLSSNLIYFKNTTITASAAYDSFTQSVLNPDSGAPEESSFIRRSMGINGSHVRRLFRGNLKISAGYKASAKKDTGSNIKEDITDLQIKGMYDKKMSRNVLLKLLAERSEVDTNGLRDITTSGEADILYRLRQWYLSAEYLHAIREWDATGIAAATEDRVMLRISRSFIRMF